MPRDLVLQAEILGVQVAFTVDAPTDPGEINETMDCYADAIRRMRAREELRYQYVELLSAVKALREVPKAKAAYHQKRLVDRTRERASWAASWAAAHPNRRADFEENAQHRQQLVAFDTETEAKLKEMDDAAASLPAQIEGLKAMIARLTRRVAGESELDALVEELDGLDRGVAPRSIAAAD